MSFTLKYLYANRLNFTFYFYVYIIHTNTTVAGILLCFYLIVIYMKKISKSCDKEGVT